MPGKKEEKKIRKIEEIMTDMTLTEEEWQKEMMDAYKAQYMDGVIFKNLRERETDLKEKIKNSLDDPNSKQAEKYMEDLKKVKESLAKEEADLEVKLMSVIVSDREKRKEFAPEKKEPEKKEEAPRKEEEPKKEESKKEEPKKEEPKKEEPKKEENKKEEPRKEEAPETEKEEKEDLQSDGPDHTRDVLRQTEKKKEKISENILTVEKNADLNFDDIDKEADKQIRSMQENLHVSGKQVKGGFKLSDLKIVPHHDTEGAEKETEAPEKKTEEPDKKTEVKKEEAPKTEIPEKEESDPQKKDGLKIENAAKYSVIKGKFSAIKEQVPHAEMTQQNQKEEALTGENKEEPEKGETKEETTKKEEPKKEEPAKEEPAKEPEEMSNVLKAFKLVDLFKSMKGHDSKTHINSGKYNSMMKAVGNVESLLGDSFGDAFGSLMRDFGNLSSFQDLCQKGGPLDLAVGQALAEVDKKCEAYVQEKTHNLTKTHMGSGLGNARLKDAMDGLSIVNPKKAKELGEHISIDVIDGKASKKMNYNELNALEREQDKDAEKKKERMEIVDGKKKEREILEREQLMSAEQKKKNQGLRL